MEEPSVPEAGTEWAIATRALTKRYRGGQLAVRELDRDITV